MTSSASNVHLDGSGNLDLTAQDANGAWTSGRVQTTTANVGAPAGGELEVTASIQQPAGGPAFWMLGPGQWPENGEIDIMEDVNSLSEVAGTVHCGVDPGGPCGEPNGTGSGPTACSGCQSGYHTYSMILNRSNAADESVTFYLDGSQYFTVTETQVGTATWQAAFDHNLSIILDLAMGGSFPDGVCGCTAPASSTTSGGTMSVAYVAAYTTGGGSSTPTSTPTNTGSSSPPTRTGRARSPAWADCASTCEERTRPTSRPLQVYTCNGTNAQQWNVVAAGTTLQALGKCLDVNGGGTTDGTAIDLYDCNDTGAQVFISRSDGTLYNPQSGKRLDDPNSSGSGTKLQIWDCSGSANQQWQLP